MANTVALTFEADAAPATGAFDEVGDSARSMSDQMDDTASGYDRAGEAADGAEGKARGFSDTLAGSVDVASGFGQIMSGDVVGGLVSVGTGAADVAGGFKEFLLPMLEKSRVVTLAKAAADRVAAAGSRAWALAQNMMNLSLLASPITWIIVGIVALIAVIVLIATKTTWFKDAWNAAWRSAKAAAVAVWEWLKKVPGWIGDAFGAIPDAITAPFALAFKLVTDTVSTWWKWLTGMIGQLGPMFSKVGGLIAAPFKAAFNAVSDAWNNTVGKWSWTAPKWIPKIGGQTIAAPKMPKLHAGGVVPGITGTEVPILAMAGERVSTSASASGGATITLGSDGGRLGDALIDLIALAMVGRAGDPAALGLRIARTATGL